MSFTTTLTYGIYFPNRTSLQVSRTAIDLQGSTSTPTSEPSGCATPYQYVVYPYNTDISIDQLQEEIMLAYTTSTATRSESEYLSIATLQPQATGTMDIGGARPSLFCAEGTGDGGSGGYAYGLGWESGSGGDGDDDSYRTGGEEKREW
ncbi:MAG: hypothetical protein MMC23_006136 [Stictis urceolatum]|nr:hypothetical protein [Stictis urceolata]